MILKIILIAIYVIWLFTISVTFGNAFNGMFSVPKMILTSFLLSIEIPLMAVVDILGAIIAALLPEDKLREKYKDVFGVDWDDDEKK